MLLLVLCKLPKYKFILFNMLSLNRWYSCTGIQKTIDEHQVCMSESRTSGQECWGCYLSWISVPQCQRTCQIRSSKEVSKILHNKQHNIENIKLISHSLSIYFVKKKSFSFLTSQYKDIFINGICSHKTNDCFEKEIDKNFICVI